MLIAEQVVALASFHDRHIAGTPYTYRHGWILLNPQVGQTVSHPDLGRGTVTSISKANGSSNVDFDNGQKFAFPASVSHNPELQFDNPSGFKHATDQDLVLNDDAPQPSDDELASMSDYISPEGSAAINDALRAGKPLPAGTGQISTMADMKNLGSSRPVPDRNQELPLLDKLIASQSFPADAHLYRGMSVSPALKSQLKPGVTFTDKGYTSATDSMDIAQMFASMRAGKGGGDMQQGEVYPGTPAIMHITVPAGSNASQGETDIGEYVLPRSSRYRVDAVSPDGSRYDLTFMGAATSDDSGTQSLIDAVTPATAVATVQRLVAAGMEVHAAANAVTARLQSQGKVQAAMTAVKTGAGA